MIVNISVKKKAQPFVGKVITWVPRHIAAKLATEYNIISIEYDNDYRPVFRGHNVLLVTSHTFYDTCIWNGEERELGEVFEEFIKTCNDGPIVVHCEMGRVRSRAIAEVISRNFDYKLVNHAKLNTTTDGMIDFNTWEPIWK